MGPLGKLSLDLFVDLHIPLQGLQLLQELLVFEEEFFGLLRLIFKFCGQLVVLQDCEPGLAIKLLLPEREEV